LSNPNERMLQHLQRYMEYKRYVATVEQRKQNVLQEMGSSTASWQNVGRKEAGNTRDIVSQKVERLVRIDHAAAEADYWVHIIDSACEVIPDKWKSIAQAVRSDQNDAAIGRRCGCSATTVSNVRKRLCAIMAELSGEE
jgi:hypothetical protein